MGLIGIIGAGTMGSGIAQVAALSDMDVLLYDASPSALESALERIAQESRRRLEKGTLSGAEATRLASAIHPARSLQELRDAEVMIEAAAEVLAVKQQIFRDISAISRPNSLLATNTSSLSITAIATAAAIPSSVVGMHFFNPPTVMNLVEVVRGTHTSEEILRRTIDLAVRMRKTPVVCRDTPGFIVNRLARPFYGEALRLLGENAADVETIDRIVRREGGFKMGPFELMDLIGIDINYAVTRSVYEQFSRDPRFLPHPIQKQMVDAGLLGRKTKRGFYRY